MAEREISRIFLFHPGAGEPFRRTVLDTYAQIHPAIQRRLESFAGARTLIRTTPFTFNDLRPEDWSGLHIAPSYQHHLPRRMPVQYRAFTQLGSPMLVLAEAYANGEPTSLAQVAYSTAHEIGHRIDSAIAGDNLRNPAPRQFFFSSSQAFIDAIRQDMRTSGSPITARYLHLLPQGLDTPPGPAWKTVAAEIFADLFAARHTTTLDDQSRFAENERMDYGIFRRAGLLVDQAVATFTGQSIMPREPYARRDYPSGVRPVPLAPPGLVETALSHITGRELFQPVGPDAPHPPLPR